LPGIPTGAIANPGALNRLRRKVMLPSLDSDEKPNDIEQGYSQKNRRDFQPFAPESPGNPGLAVSSAGPRY